MKNNYVVTRNVPEILDDELKLTAVVRQHRDQLLDFSVPELVRS